MGAPTAEYIKELARDRQLYFTERDQEIVNNRAMRYMELPVQIPDNYRATTKEIRSPMIPDMLFRVVSTLTADAPGIECAPMAPTERAQRNSSLRERWTIAMLESLQNDIGRQTFRMGIDAACADGLGVWKLIHRADAWNGEPKRKRTKVDDAVDAVVDNEEAEKKSRYEKEEASSYNQRVEDWRKGAPPPFLWTDIDALTYFPVPDAYKVSEVLEISRRQLRPAMKALGVYRQSNGAFASVPTGAGLPPEGEIPGSSQTVECIEHWDSEYVTYMLDGQLVKSVAHKYGRPPYFELGGHTTSSRDPAKATQSIIQPFKHLIPAIDRLLTILSNWVYLMGWPLMVMDDPGSGGLTPTTPHAIAQLEPGRIIKGVKFMPVPGAAKDLYQFFDILRLMVDRSGLAAVMYGQGASSSSGYMVSQLMTAAQIVYDPILDNGAMALQQMVQHMWRIIERVIRQPVPVWGAGTGKDAEWLSFGPEDVGNYYQVKAKIKPLLPMDEMAQRDSAQRMAGGQQLWSAKQALEKTGAQAPEEQLDEIREERLINHPAIDQMMVDILSDKIFAVKRQRQAALTGGAPFPELPPGVMPPPGMGANMPTEGNAMGPMGPIQPMIPGVNMPMVPPPPVGAGMPPEINTAPVGIQRRPGGNFGPPPGAM